MKKNMFLSAVRYAVIGISKVGLCATHYMRPNGDSYCLEDGNDWSNAYNGLPVIIIIFLLLLPVKGFAATCLNQLEESKMCHYVTPTGNGSETGEDWSNAYGFDTVTFTRDHVYVIAGGAYSTNKTFNTSESGSTYIYIRKATSEATYNDDIVSGWSASYNNPAVFTSTSTADGRPFYFTTGYWDLSGLTGAGGGVSGPSIDYGFKIVNEEISAQAIYVLNVDYIKLQYMHIDLIDNYQSSSGIYYKETSYASQCSDGTLDGHYVGNMYFQGGIEHIRAWCMRDWIVENSYFYDQATASDPPGSEHAETFPIVNGDGSIFRYNYFDAVCTRTGGWMVLGNTSLYRNPCGESNMKIYGNVFVDCKENSCFGSANSTSASCSTTNWLIYNNTFVNSKPKFYAPANSNGHKFKNNIFYYNTTNDQDGGSIDMDYNYYSINLSNIPSHTTTYVSAGSEDPFANRTGGDYSLSSSNDAIDSGTNLGASYNTDMADVTRGGDGTWDIGAYEASNVSLLSPPKDFGTIEAE